MPCRLALAAIAVGALAGTGAAQVATSEGCDRLQLAALDRPAEIEPLLAAGVKLDCRDEYGYTALHVAASAGRADAVAWLIERGAEVNAVDDLGLTPLSLLMLSRRLGSAADARGYDRAWYLLRAAGGRR